MWIFQRKKQQEYIMDNDLSYYDNIENCYDIEGLQVAACYWSNEYI